MRAPSDSPSENKFYPRGTLAIALAERWKIIPLIPGGKTPAIAQWPERATTDVDTIIGWWMEKDYNIGLVSGSYQRSNGGGPAVPYCLVVVDYDMKDGQQGGKALFRHERLDGLCDTLTSKTPHGVHKLYWATHPVPNSLSRIAPNVDVRGIRGYIVAPGSTVGGVDYVWTGEFTEPAPWPEEFDVLAMAGKSGVHVPDQTHSKAPLGELDRPDQIKRTREYLVNEAPEAIEGAHGDETTYRVAATIKDFGLSEAMCLDQMLLFWNEEKAFPPWAFDALRTKVSNAYKYGQSPPGVADPLVEFGEFGVGNSGLEGPTDRQKTPKSPLVLESFDQASDQAFNVDSQPLIENLLSLNNVSVLYGQSNSGKTFVALDMAYAVATGTPWNGHPVRRGTVVYLAAEGLGGIRKRFRALRTKFGRDGRLLMLIRSPVDLLHGMADTQRVVDAIREAAQKTGQGVVMVVIDTLSRVLAGGQENSSEDMGVFIKHVDLIRDAAKAHIMVIHHAGKDIARGARGWSGVVASIDTEIEIHDNVVSITKQRDLDALPSIRFELETIRMTDPRNGEIQTSCVLAWGAVTEFEVSLSRAEQAVYDALSHWKDKEPGAEITVDAFRRHLVNHEPVNPLGERDRRTLEGHLTVLAEKTKIKQGSTSKIWLWIVPAV